MMRQNQFWLYQIILLAILVVALAGPLAHAHNKPDQSGIDGLLVSYALENPAPLFLPSKSQKRVALYLRVSTDEQKEEGHSLETQEQRMREYCQRRGWEIVAVYRDEALSGRLSDRPGLQQLLTDVRAGKFDVVMVFYISRFYRKLEALLSALKLFRNCNVSFVSINEDIDFTTKWGKLILNILGTLAEIYVDELSEVTSGGKRQNAQNGDLNGSIPFGYCNGLCNNCKDPNGPGYCPLVGRAPLGNGEVLVHHPLESQAVELGYEWYSTGQYSFADIAYLLNQHQVEFEGKLYSLRPKRKKGDLNRYGKNLIFGADTIGDMLNRAFYTGIVEYYGGKGVAEERKRFKKPQAVFKGNHKSIISSDLYKRVEAIRGQRCYRPVSAENEANARVYLLSRILYSWPMGNKMRSTTTGSNVRKYRDRANIGKSKLDQVSRSPQPLVAAELLETQVVEVLNTLVIPAEWHQRILAYLVSAEGGMADIERQRRDLQARFEHLTYLFSQRDCTRAQYEQEKARLSQEMSNLLCPTNLGNAEVQAVLTNPAELWRQATPAELKELLETVFERVYVQGEDIVRVEPHLAFLALPLYVKI